MTTAASRVVQLGDERFGVERTAEGIVRIADLGGPYRVVEAGDGSLLVFDDTRRWRVLVSVNGSRCEVFVNGEVYDFQVEEAGRRRRAAGHAAAEAVTAPMPARVVRILVEAGAQVRRGDLVATLEAMKMELPLRSPRDGRVREVTCTEGELVQPGTPLMEIV